MKTAGIFPDNMHAVFKLRGQWTEAQAAVPGGIEDLVVTDSVAGSLVYEEGSVKEQGVSGGDIQ